MNTFQTWIEIPITVTYSRQPAEKATRHYPGCPESVEEISLSFKGQPLPERLERWISNYDYYAGQSKMPRHSPMDAIMEECLEDMRGEK